jgi:hypothetical protein
MQMLANIFNQLQIAQAVNLDPVGMVITFFKLLQGSRPYRRL